LKAWFVTKRLAFGSAIGSWQDVRRLHQLGITHVVNLRFSREYKKKLRSFHSIWLPFRDDKEPRPSWFYRQALRFHVEAMRYPNTKVFVMCHHGICRSASLAYFLLRANGHSPGRASAAVLKARSKAIIHLTYRECGEDFLKNHRIRKASRNKRTGSQGAST
jgi:protein-tyrosine phosphatase